MLPQVTWHQVIDKWYGNFRKIPLSREKSNTSEGITFFPKKIHRNEPYHLNSNRNNRIFHENGKRHKIMKKKNPKGEGLVRVKKIEAETGTT